MVPSPALADTNWAIVGTGDFNNDGKTDILWRNTSTGENYVWYMNGVRRIGRWYPSCLADTNWAIVGTGDFNGDGKTDILWRNTVNRRKLCLVHGRGNQDWEWYCFLPGRSPIGPLWARVISTTTGNPTSCGGIRQQEKIMSGT